MMVVVVGVKQDCLSSTQPCCGCWTCVAWLLAGRVPDRKIFARRNAEACFNSAEQGFAAWGNFTQSYAGT
jgi:hypothetical protein